MQRPIWIGVLLTACASTPPESLPAEATARLAAEVRACTTDVMCVFQRMTIGPAAFGTSRVDPAAQGLPVVATPALAFDVLLATSSPPVARVLDSGSVEERMIASLIAGVLASRLVDGVALAVLDSALPQLARQRVAARMIELGAKRPEPYAVLQHGLCATDRAVVRDAGAAIERLAHEIPKAMHPVFASLLREQGLSAARLD
jgi:hypothetical protein